MWVAFANAKATHIFSAKILVYMPYLMIKVFNDTLTNDVVGFEHLGPGDASKNARWVANSVESIRSHILIWVHTVCLGLSAWILG